MGHCLSNFLFFRIHLENIALQEDRQLSLRFLPEQQQQQTKRNMCS